MMSIVGGGEGVGRKSVGSFPTQKIRIETKTVNETIMEKYMIDSI